LSKSHGANASALMVEEQNTQTARLTLMRNVLRSLMDSEDGMERGMGWSEIVILPGENGANVRKAIDDLLTLKYIVCATVSGIEETCGEVRMFKLCELYRTTFFGRKWFLESENG
jgi:hypothetical protein